MPAHDTLSKKQSLQQGIMWRMPSAPSLARHLEGQSTSDATCSFILLAGSPFATISLTSARHCLSNAPCQS